MHQLAFYADSFFLNAVFKKSQDSSFKEMNAT